VKILFNIYIYYHTLRKKEKRKKKKKKKKGGKVVVVDLEIRIIMASKSSGNEETSFQRF
jgi:hypothetical protein